MLYIPVLTWAEQLELPAEYMQAYDEGNLFTGDFYDGARWTLRQFSSWYWGDLLGGAFDDIVVSQYDWNTSNQPWA